MRHASLAALLMILIAHPLPAADAPDAAERTRQTILYGIDSQVLEIIQSVSKSQDQGFTKELAQVLSEQRSADVRTAVLNLFKDQKVEAGEGQAREIVKGWQDGKPALVAAAVKYLAAMESSGLAASLPPLVDASDNGVALAAIQALGAVGDTSSAELLCAKLKSLDYPDARKTDIILALGALKNPAAVEQLLEIAKNTDEEKVRRMYAADSLGKIGDSRALPVLRDMFAENDALIRQYAASALSRFGLDEVFPSLIQGLRDENAKVREQSAKTLARGLSASQADAALPILAFKAEYDPSSGVRIASIQALGAIGGNGAFDLLLKLFGGSAYPLESREAALGILAAKDLGRSMETIRKVIDAEWTAFDSRTLTSVAKVLSTVKAPELREAFVRFLDSKEPTVRSYGVRGIALNGFSDLKDRLKKMAEGDANAGTRREAEKALEKL
jgi:HEAT repeat protein